MPIVIAAPAAVVAAIFALLFMLAWHQWQGVIVNALSVDLPVIGNVLGRLVSESLEGTYLILVGWFDALLTPLVEFIIRPVAAVENTVEALADLGTELAAQAYIWGASGLPGLIGVIDTTNLTGLTELYVRIENDITNTVNAGVNISLTAVGDIEQSLLQRISTLDAEVAAIEAGAVTAGLDVARVAQIAAQTAAGLVATGVAQAEQYTLDAYNAATAYASTLAQTVENDLAAGINAAETFATTADLAIGAALVTDLDNAITGALSGIWTDVESEVLELERVIGTDDAAILEAVKALPRVLPGDIAAVAALAGVTTLTLTRYLRDCGIPNCKNLSRFGQDLQALLSVVEDASFLDFIIGLIHNPSGAAGAVDDALGGSIRATTGTFKQLVGI